MRSISAILLLFICGPLLADSGFRSPTANDGTGTWSNPNNAHTSNDSYAVGTVEATEVWKTFGFDLILTGTETISGIEVRAEAKKNASAPFTLTVYLSWDSGTSWSLGRALEWTEASDTLKTFGSSEDIWGRTWDADDFDDAVFRVKIDLASSATGSLDHLEVNVYGGDSNAQQVIVVD